MAKTLSNNNNDINNEGVSSKEESDNEEVIIRGTLKKGPWTLAEDIMLREYVMKYGEGNWNSVQKNSKLARCGKSCRLRWANHLKPNLKKGAFSREEEQIIVQLHANLGNKWARMAAQLPGRTDNEIKNFWNTRVKRCQRAGLPLYPPEVVYEATLNHHQQQHNHLTQPYTTSSPFQFSSFISSANTNCHKLNDLTYPSSNNKQNQIHNSSYYTNLLYSQFNFPNETNSNGNMNLSSLSLSPLSPYASSSSSLFNQSGFVTNNNNNNNNNDNSHDYHHHSGGTHNNNNDFHNYSNNNNNNNVAMPSSPLYESLPLMQSSNTEASLSQSSPPSSTTPTSSYANGDVYGLMSGGGASSTKANNNKNGYEVVAPLSSPHHQGNSGFLDDAIVAEDNSKSGDSTTSSKELLLSRKRKNIETEGSSSKKEEDTVLVESTNKNDGNTNSSKIQRVDSKPFQFSAGNTQIVEDGLEGINSMDDDLFGLLNNFQEIPIPDWYHRGQPLGAETQRDASLGLTDQEFAIHGNFWRNMSNKF